MPSNESGSLAHVYAEALHDVASESGRVAQVEQELLDLQAVVRKDPVLLRFFETPTVTAQEKRKVILGTFTAYSTETLNFLSLLVHKRRVNLLERIADAFHKHSNLKAGIAELKLDSARALEPAEREHMVKVLQERLGLKVILKEEVQPALLGGFVLTHADKQWNASLVYRLGRVVNGMERAKDALGVWKD